MQNPIFQWIDCTDRTRPRQMSRPDDVKLRFAQLTDPHVSGQVDLMGRLRDLMGAPDSFTDLSYKVGVLTNEIGHHLRSQRHRYMNLIKKALFGLHQLEVDHLLMTGDLSHCSMPAEFLDLRGALEVTGWWGDDKLTVIPGNHDRFNLYEDVPKEPMDAFFDVVRPREPRVKTFDQGVAVVELDTNGDRIHDRHPTEFWLPNTVGKIYPAVPRWFADQHDELAGMRVIALLHHHITDDWYTERPVSAIGNLMAPAEGVDALIDALELVDPAALLLHGHKHDVMPVDYHYRGHPVSCPGGFAEALSINLIDVDAHDEATITQVALRD